MNIGEKLAALMALSYEVNSNTEYAVYCEFSGHVNLISLRVCRGKEPGASIDRLFSEDIYMNHEKIDRIDGWLVYLNDLMKQEVEA